MKIDIDMLRNQSEDLIELKLVNLLPRNDTAPIRRLYRFLRHFYTIHPVEKVKESFQVIVPENHMVNLPLTMDERQCIRIESIPNIISFPAVIVLFDDRIILCNDTSCNITEIPDQVLVYELKEHEGIWLNGQYNYMPASPINCRSVFASPSYDILDEALTDYNLYEAQKCVCEKLAQAWADNQRLRWKNAPESLLRDSLYRFLRATIRNVAEVKREQNVTVDNPVDIKVTFYNTHARGLIEIKWLGVSIDQSGNITQNFTAWRARAGARQLIKYIDKSILETPTLDHMGYLVVFDGRRRKVSNLTATILDSDAWYYKDREINYDPNLIARSDLRLRYRFFIEPEIAAS